ncbi:MAG: C45 family peptidase [Planctomycetota bacterium]
MRSFIASLLYLLAAVTCSVSICHPVVAQSNSAQEVAGSRDDFAIVKHFRASGSQQEIGAQLYQLALEHDWQPSEVADRAKYDAQLNYLRVNWPAQFEKLEGIAAARGEDLATSNYNFTDLGYAEVAGGCSCFYIPPALSTSEGGLFSRNYDFTTGAFDRQPVTETNPPACSRPYIIETHPDEGYSTIGVVCFDFLGIMDGMNSEGLTVALLADDEIMSTQYFPSPGGRAGLGVVDVPRFLLETCATCEEAKRALYQAKLFYQFIPCHYLVADRYGNSFIWENKAAMNDGEAFDGNGELQITTNFMVHLHADELDSLPAEPAPWGSFNRYCRVRELVEQSGSAISLEDTCRIASSVAANYKYNQGDIPARTLWHSVYDPDRREMRVDFYLGEGEDTAIAPGDGAYPRTQVRRSDYLTFTLTQPATTQSGR